MLDLLIVAGFVLYSVTAGFRAKRLASRDLDQYFLAGRTLSGWRAGCSMAATQFAADTPLLVTGLVATGGVFLLWRLWIYGLSFLLLGFLFAALWRRARVITDAELAEARYGGRASLWLRGFKAIYYGAVINGAVMAMVLVAALRITELFLPWHTWLPEELYAHWRSLAAYVPLSLGESVTGLAPPEHHANALLSVAALLLFVALYSMTGGLRAVVATDVVQLAFAMGGTLCYAWYVVREIGGLAALRTRLEALYGAAGSDRFLSFAPPAGEALAPFLVLVSIQWIFQMNSDGTGYLAQRAMACRDEREARRAAILFAWIQIAARSLLWLLIAVGLLVLYPIAPGEADAPGFAASRELLFATGIRDLLPPGVRGAMLTALLAALASTIDTHLNWGASYFSNDLYRRVLCGAILRREPGGRELVWVARGANVAVLLLALWLMGRLGSIQEAWHLSLLFGAGVGGVLVLRWVWERITAASEFAAMGASLAAAPLALRYLDGEAAQLCCVALAGTSAAVLAALAVRKRPDAALVEFYERVRPPGFWRATASAASPPQPAEPLLRPLRDTARSAMALYLFLVGAGSALLRGPHPFALSLCAASLLLVFVERRRVS